MSSYICPVCRDLLSEPKEVDPSVKRDEYHPVITYCGHMFHFYCLMGWFKNQLHNGQPYACPTCWEPVLDTDVVKMFPASDDKYENYNSLHRKCNKLSLDVKVLEGDLEASRAKIHAWEEMVNQSDEKIEELTEKIEKLEVLIERNKEAAPITKEMKSIYTETTGQSFVMTVRNVLDVNLCEARNCKNILKYIQMLVNETDDPKTKTMKTGDEECNPFSYTPGRKSAIPKDEEILKKIKNIFTSRVLFETVEQSTKRESKIICKFIPGFSHQTELMSVSVSFEKEEKVKKFVNSIGNLRYVQIPVVLYTHRGKIYSPEFELFQLQLSTFLRMCGIHHSCQVLTLEEDKDMPVMILGEKKIFESDMCCAAIKEYFYLTTKVQVLQLKSAEPKSLTTVKNILNTTILWGLLLWQWVHDDGKSMRIFPRKYSNEFCIAMKKNLYIITSDKMQSFLDKDILFQNVANDIRILSEQLGLKYYFSGTLPGEVDASAFILLSQMLWNSAGSPFAEQISNCKNLVDFILRIKHSFWPDWGNEAHMPHL